MGSGGSKKQTVTEEKEKQSNKDTVKKIPRKQSLSTKTGVQQSPKRESQKRDPPKGVRRHSDQTPRKNEKNVDKATIVPYEAENLNLEGDWEIEKGIDDVIPPRDFSYPSPKPTKVIQDTSIYLPVDYQVMTNNLSEPNLANNTFEEVTKHLTSEYSLEILKVRALSTWISCQKIRTRNYGNDVKADSVMAYMRQIKELKGTFAGLLTLLCRSIDIPCVIVKGIYKSHFHHVGDDDVGNSRCTWNAVHVDGNWQLVHPYLMCTSLSITTPQDDWKIVETSVENSDQKIGSVLNTFFFAPDPSEFIYFCLPDNSNSLWQLLDERHRYSDFLHAPFLRPAFFSTKMQLKSKSNCVMLTEAGRSHIEIRCSQDNVQDLIFMYELYAKDPEFPDLAEDYGKTVICERNEDTWHIITKFPVDGTFKLALYAKLNDWFFWVGDFKIICDKPLNNYVRTPTVPGEISFGPCALTEESGLLAPSHEGGIIFFKPQEEYVIKFLTVEKMQFSHAIEHTEIDSEDLHDCCKVIRRKSEVDFIVNLPYPGEYVLRINKVDDQEDEHNVCNYLFIDADESLKREGLFQRKARTKLKEATAGREIEPLENALRKWDDVKLPHDAHHQRGVRRLQYLKITRDLRDGRMRKHEGTLVKSIEEAENSRFKKAIEPSITKSKRMLDDIQSLEMHCHPVSKLEQKTIAEIANFANPPRDVHDTMIATYRLLGEDKQYLQKWGNIQTLLRRTGKLNIKNLVDEFRDKPLPDSGVIKQVQHIYDNIPKQYILSASLSAAAFYDWVGNVLGYVNNRSQNATEPDDSLDEITIDDLTYDSNQSLDKEETGNISQDEGFADSPDL